MTKEELIKEYVEWSGHPYKDLAHAFHTDLIAFAKHCFELDKSHRADWTRENKEEHIVKTKYE